LSSVAVQRSLVTSGLVSKTVPFPSRRLLKKERKTAVSSPASVDVAVSSLGLQRAKDAVGEAVDEVGEASHGVAHHRQPPAEGGRDGAGGGERDEERDDDGERGQDDDDGGDVVDLGDEAVVRREAEARQAVAVVGI